MWPVTCRATSSGSHALRCKRTSESCEKTSPAVKRRDSAAERVWTAAESGDVIASAAKQPRVRARGPDCFAALAMTVQPDRNLLCREKIKPGAYQRPGNR